MYNGPGITWEQDEGLEYTDEEAELCYEEFYEDVHTEFLKYGELVNFKVCRFSSAPSPPFPSFPLPPLFFLLSIISHRFILYKIRMYVLESASNTRG
jgi:hypothetical protein